MTLADIDGRPTPADILDERREKDSSAGSHDDRDASYKRGREFVEDFVAECVAPGEHVYKTARRILLDIGEREQHERPGLGASQAVGRTLAAHERDATPDGYLPEVDVSRWADSDRTTWRIEVSDQ
jgi:hypothetical protein